MTKYLDNPHAGIILQEEFLEPLGLSQNALAQAIGVPANRISEIIRGRRGITADTDLRLSLFLGTSEGYWLHMQNSYDMMEAKRFFGDAIKKIVPYIKVLTPARSKTTSKNKTLPSLIRSTKTGTIKLRQVAKASKKTQTRTATQS